MVNFVLYISADLENLTNFSPRFGVDDPSFTYFFKLKCENCGEVTEKETCVSLNEEVPGAKRGTINLIQKCKFCKREGNITMIPGRGYPLTISLSETEKPAPLMTFDCRGVKPLDFAFNGGWKADSIKGTRFVDIDLTGGEFAEYDEEGKCPVMISNLRAEFKVVDPSKRIY
uniref:CXXC motif containing zinc binding protein n=1 Tax=Erigeron canadensis TaxID=72917 RepID=UPI001CB926E9|nr:CXXC motif containing zinc binding protein [Erigeron canadensis]